MTGCLCVQRACGERGALEGANACRFYDSIIPATLGSEHMSTDTLMKCCRVPQSAKADEDMRGMGKWVKQTKSQESLEINLHFVRRSFYDQQIVTITANVK